MDPMTMGLISQFGGMALKGMFKQNNPYLEAQKTAQNSARRQAMYHEQLFKDQRAQADRMRPTYEKLQQRSMEAATKPVTNTSMYKNLGPLAGILQAQGDASSAAAARSAGSRGLYGGQQQGVVDASRNATNSAIAKSMADYVGNYESAEPARIAGAAQAAGNAYQTGIASADQALSGATNNYNNVAQYGQQIGAAQQAARDAADAQHAQLMQLLGGYFGNQAEMRQQDKDIAQRKASSDTFNERMRNMGAGSREQRPGMAPNGEVIPYGYMWNPMTNTIDYIGGF
jgi:hypothetical protein